MLKRALPHVVVKVSGELERFYGVTLTSSSQGLPTIARALISAKEENPKEKQLLVEGYGLKEVMSVEGERTYTFTSRSDADCRVSIPGIVGTKTRSNHVMDMAKVLGIEAARRTIYDEIQHTMRSHGMSIDPRHVMLLGDVMTYKVGILARYAVLR